MTKHKENKKNNYKLHQELLNKVKLALQKRFPTALICDQHVGMFFTHRGTPVKIGKKGMSDLWMLYNSRYICIEIKSGNATQSKFQKQWQEVIESKGSEYYVMRSIDDVELIDI